MCVCFKSLPEKEDKNHVITFSFGVTLKLWKVLILIKIYDKHGLNVLAYGRELYQRIGFRLRLLEQRIEEL